MTDEIKTTGACSIPALGLGTWKLNGNECETVVEQAIDLGYRHIDTAAFYENEEEVGRAIKGYEREKLFVTTKVWKDKLRYNDFKKSTETSLRKLETEYVDLLLVHWPNPEVPIEETTRAMNELVEEGKTRHIGVSNFSRSQLEEAKNLSDHPIVNNQVKYHLGMDLDPLLNYCRENNVLLTAYSPLGRGKVLEREEVKELARKYEKSPGQIALKWLIEQENVVAIPKAGSVSHLRENIQLFDWDLDEDDRETLNRLVIKTQIN